MSPKTIPIAPTVSFRRPPWWWPGCGSRTSGSGARAAAASLIFVPRRLPGVNGRMARSVPAPNRGARYAFRARGARGSSLRSSPWKGVKRLLGDRGRRVLLGGLLGAEDVASVGAGSHRFPGARGAQAAVADIVERGLVGVGASLGGAGGIEIMLC